jgi:hypothetical protein
MRRSRLLGALVGGAIGAVTGLGVTWALYGQEAAGEGFPLWLQAALAVGATGASLGALFGVPKK